MAPGQLDHLVVAAQRLEAGAAAVEATLGVTLAPGGAHPQMGTHNRLLSLGEGLYLEVISVNPAAAGPRRPRWFDLDCFAGQPRLTNWVARCENLKEALALAPPGSGEIHDLARGDFRWRMAIPADGRLPDAGCRLRRLTLVHPEAAALRVALSGLVEDPRLALEEGAETALRAEIATPHGVRVLA
ncbi:MAG: VOC family protein [Paracoccaceae bacterium]|nr:VOC family protein [Paracoccaceae bacterium]